MYAEEFLGIQKPPFSFWDKFFIVFTVLVFTIWFGLHVYWFISV